MSAMTTFYSPTPIDLDAAIHKMPAIVAGAHHSRSDRYEHIPTLDMLRGLMREGFQIFGLQSARVRDVDRNGFQKHMIRMRHSDAVAKLGDVAREVVLLNSHDGSSAYDLRAGLFRFICANGLVAGKFHTGVKVPHKGKETLHRVIEGSFKVLAETGAVLEAADTMKAISLQREEQEAFARAAAQMRYQPGDSMPVTPEAFNRPRRREDVSPDLWTTFNRVQENMIRGGLRGVVREDNGATRRATVRPVNGIDQNVRLNQALFTLAEEMARIKAGLPLQAAA